MEKSNEWLKTAEKYLLEAKDNDKVLDVGMKLINELQLHQTELERQKDELQTIFDSSRSLIFYKDKENKFLQVNKAFADILGLPKEQLEGKSLFDIFPKEQAEAYWKDDKEVMNSERPKYDIVEPMHFKNSIHYVQTDKIPYRDVDSNIIGIIGFATDITERKYADEKLNKTLKKYNQVNRTLLALKNSSSAMIHAIDEEYYLDDVCRIIVEDCGHSMVWIGFIDETKRRVIPVAYSGFEEDYLNALNIILDDSERGQGPTGTAICTGKPSVCENMQTDPKFKPWREEATKRGYSSSIVLPLTNNNKVFGALNIYSKDANPFSEEEKELLNELAKDISYGIISIRTRIAHRKAEKALLKSFKEVERSNSELEQFAYVASHDLQEPLRMVSSFLQLLQRRYVGKLDSDADEFIEYAVDGAKRMQELIQDLLEYSRVTTKGKEFKDIKMDETLNKALNNLKISIKENEVRITQDPLPIVKADYSQIIQLLQNLIGNAIKYRSEENPEIHISAEKIDKKWVFAVKDNGIGIDSKYADRIFALFQRLHSNNEYDGTGIGLAISKSIVERHGGNIWLESEQEKGSTFYFTIPR